MDFQFTALGANQETWGVRGSTEYAGDATWKNTAEGIKLESAMYENYQPYFKLSNLGLVFTP